MNMIVNKEKFYRINILIRPKLILITLILYLIISFNKFYIYEIQKQNFGSKEFRFLNGWSDRFSVMDKCNLHREDGEFLCQNEIGNKVCDNIINSGESENYIKKWKPKSCSLYTYDTREIHQCFSQISKKQKYFFFFGDSRIRYIFNQVCEMIVNSTLPPKYQHDVTLFEEESQTNFTFIWSSYTDDNFLKDIKKLEKLSRNHEMFLLIGITLHMIKHFNLSEKGLKIFSAYLTKAKKDLKKISEKHPVVWFLQPHKKIPLGSSYEVNSEIDEYNHAVTQILKDTTIKMWFSTIHMAEKSVNDYMDNTHLSSYANYNFAQIIFNFICNSRRNLSDKFCCTMKIR